MIIFVFYLLSLGCEILQSPDNGVVVVKGDFYPGSIAAYECDEGYVLSAKNNMQDCTCEGWNSHDPTCGSMWNMSFYNPIQYPTLYCESIIMLIIISAQKMKIKKIMSYSSLWWSQ